eukprot:6210588-Pleurochrysis_carterae.AAC.3
MLCQSKCGICRAPIACGRAFVIVAFSATETEAAVTALACTPLRRCARTMSEYSAVRVQDIARVRERETVPLPPCVDQLCAFLHACQWRLVQDACFFAHFILEQRVAMERYEESRVRSRCTHEASRVNGTTTAGALDA